LSLSPDISVLLGNAVAGLKDKMDEFSYYVGSFLLFQAANISTTRWAPYLCRLRDALAFKSPIAHFSQEELEELQFSDVTRDVSRLQSCLEDAYSKICSSGLIEDVPTFEDFVLAYSLADTYSIDSPFGRALVPVIDLFSTSAEPNCIFRYTFNLVDFNCFIP
jgi:hypothetical protein